jgi:hypothetical protein
MSTACEALSLVIGHASDKRITHVIPVNLCSPTCWLLDCALLIIAAAAAAVVPILQLLVKDVSQRLKLSDVADHPWIKANADPAVLSLDARDKSKSAAAAAAGAGAGDGSAM